MIRMATPTRGADRAGRVLRHGLAEPREGVGAPGASRTGTAPGPLGTVTAGCRR